MFNKLEDNPPKTKVRAEFCTRCGKKVIPMYGRFLNGYTFCDVWCDSIFFGSTKR